LEELENLLSQVVTLDINADQIIQHYAAIDHFSRSIGRRLGKNDVWIAATTRSYSIPVLTTDKDFDHLDPEWVQRQWIDERSIVA